MIFIQKEYEFYTCSPKGNTMRRNGINMYASLKSTWRDLKSQESSLVLRKFQRGNSQHGEETDLLVIPLTHPELRIAEIMSSGLI